MGGHSKKKNKKVTEGRDSSTDIAGAKKDGQQEELTRTTESACICQLDERKIAQWNSKQP